MTGELGGKEVDDPALKRAVEELCRGVGGSGKWGVYGGARWGRMGRLAHSVLTAGGEVSGVGPQFFSDAEVQYDGLTRLIVTQDMTERKTKMIELGDAFIAFPGGTGTLEESTAVISQGSPGHLGSPSTLYAPHRHYARTPPHRATKVHAGRSSPARHTSVCL